MWRSRVELFEAIRWDRRLDESVSVRGLADRYQVHRRTVRAALANAVAPQRKPAERAAPRLDEARALIDVMLTGDLDAPRKQRHTAVRVHARLVGEHGLDISYSTVRDYVRVARARIWAAAGWSLDEVYLAQWHEPGAEAEVDFADLWVDLAGVRVKWYLLHVADVVFGQGDTPGVPVAVPGGVPGRARGRGHRLGRGPGRADPL